MTDPTNTELPEALGAGEIPLEALDAVSGGLGATKADGWPSTPPE